MKFPSSYISSLPKIISDFSVPHTLTRNLPIVSYVGIEITRSFCSISVFFFLYIKKLPCNTHRVCPYCLQSPFISTTFLHLYYLLSPGWFLSTPFLCAKFPSIKRKIYVANAKFCICIDEKEKINLYDYELKFVFDFICFAIVLQLLQSF